jgi:hypothetical protein
MSSYLIRSSSLMGMVANSTFRFWSMLTIQATIGGHALKHHMVPTNKWQVGNSAQQNWGFNMEMSNGKIERLAGRKLFPL